MPTLTELSNLFDRLRADPGDMGARHIFRRVSEQHTQEHFAAMDDVRQAHDAWRNAEKRVRQMQTEILAAVDSNKDHEPALEDLRGAMAVLEGARAQLSAAGERLTTVCDKWRSAEADVRRSQFAILQGADNGTGDPVAFQKSLDTARLALKESTQAIADAARHLAEVATAALAGGK